MLKAEILQNNVIVIKENVVSDSVKFETVSFKFPKSWDGFIKTAVFNTEAGQAVNVILAEGNSLCISENECYIPHEVLSCPGFELSVFGVCGDSVATATKAYVKVLESGFADGAEPEEPTPDEYQQILNLITESKEIAQSVRADADNGLFKGEKGDKGDTGDQGPVGEKGEKGEKGEDGIITNLDQTYNPERENAQSGKAIAEAIKPIENEIFRWDEFLDETGFEIGTINAGINNNSNGLHGDEASSTRIRTKGLVDVSNIDVIKIEAADKNWIAPLGFNCDGFEKEMGEYLSGSSYSPYSCLSLNSGTSALHLAVKLAGVKRGDVVLCSDMTFAATVNPVSYEGGIQVYIDSDKETWNMDPVALEKAFKKYPEARVVMLAHLYGTPAKMDEIIEVCRKHNAVLIEDAAEALSATYKGKQCGTFGKYNVVSFNGNKIITTSGGGMLITEDKKARDKACFILAGIDENSLLQAVDTAILANENGDYGIPVPDYVEENVSTKVVKLIQSYTGVVNKMVWRKG